MAVPDHNPETSNSTKLYELLRRAQNVKQHTTIDPQLQVSALIESHETLVKPREGGREDQEHAVEAAAKSIFYSIIGTTQITDPSFVSVWNLLDILLYYGDRDLCSPQLVLLLVEELLDRLSLAGCRMAFNFLESRRETIITPKSQSKELVILRLSNELLRRLSRAEDPVFCGRVYIFMFQSFSLGDKSSVNLRGNFHVENVTTFEDFPRPQTPAEDGMQVDSRPTDSSVEQEKASTETKDESKEAEESAETKEPTMDTDELYPVLWSLQHSFSNPPRLFEEDNFKTFRASLEATLAKFQEVPKVVQAADPGNNTGSQPQASGDADEFASASNPKYLTSRDLFQLELSDLAFQRHILVQALILIDFLVTLTEKAKEKPYYQRAQKAMQYGFTLGDEDTEWALGIKNSIANYLQDGPDGKFYYRMVDTVLSRDKNWVRWKMESCQSFTRERVPAKDYLTSKSGAQVAVGVKKTSKPSRAPQGLGFLAAGGPERGMEGLKHHERFSRPSAQQCWQQVQRIEMDLEMAGTEEERSELGEKKQSSTWRGLRLASQRQLASLDKVEHGRALKSLFQPGEQPQAGAASGEQRVGAGPEGRDGAPQKMQPSVEEPRADQHRQMTTERTERTERTEQRSSETGAPGRAL